jgi:hypothetical protein
MPEWLILVAGDPWDLQLLDTDFSTGNPRVFADGHPDRVVESSEVQAIDDQLQAEDQARQVVAMINGAMLTSRGNEFEPVEFAGLMRINDQGGRDYYDHGTVVARVRIRDEGAAQTPSSASAWVGKRSDSKVGDVLRILGRGELDWYDMYKVFELIESDAGMAQVEAWEPDIRRFIGTANNAGALGDAARHADTGKKPHSNPMTPAEALSLIRNLAGSWLPTK